MKKKLSIAIAIVFAIITSNNVFSQTSAVYGGNGTEENPYEISTVAQFQAFSDTINASNGAPYKDYANTYFKLTANLDLSSGFTYHLSAYTTNNTAPYFAGTFDGQKYVISNFNVNASSSNQQNVYIGLFTCLKGTVKNLGVSNAIISYTDNNDNDNDNVYCGIGIITGMINYSTAKVDSCYIINSSVTCTGNSNNSIHNAFIGGIVGHASWGYVTNSYALNVNVTCENAQTGYVGVIGSHAGTNDEDGLDHILSNCLYSGEIVNHCTNSSTNDTLQSVFDTVLQRIAQNIFGYNYGIYLYKEKWNLISRIGYNLTN